LSSNEAVATVSGGTVTAIGPGSATITATSTANTGISGTATVNVIIPITGAAIEINFEGMEDETIELGIVPQGTNFIITAPSGYARYLWYLDGGYEGTTLIPTLTVTPYGILPGPHYLTVMVEKTGGSYFSKTVRYTVGY
jgi:hypothetical protein